MPFSNRLKKVLAMYLCFTIPFTLVASPTPNDISELSRLSSNDALGVQKGSIYVDGDESMDTLMPVRIFGAVLKAGIHYVPQKIDVVTLVSLAGGTSPDAELSEVTIKRVVNGKHEVVEVDLEELVQRPTAASVVLNPNDTVFIPHEKFLISEGVARTVSVLTGIAAVVVSAVAIANSRRSE